MKRALFILLFFYSVTLLFSQDTTHRDKVYIPKQERSKGYVGWIEAGINIFPLGVKHYTPLYPCPSIRVFNGARLNRSIILGGEVGLDYGAQIPADIKVQVHGPLKIKAQKLSIYADFGAGYSFLFLYENAHGFNFAPGVGFKIWGHKDKAAFTFRASYYGLISRETYRIDYFQFGYTSDPSRKATYYYNGTQIMVGVEF